MVTWTVKILGLILELYVFYFMTKKWVWVAHPHLFFIHIITCSYLCAFYVFTDLDCMPFLGSSYATKLLKHFIMYRNIIFNILYFQRKKSRNIFFTHFVTWMQKNCSLLNKDKEVFIDAIIFLHFLL